jgi:ABC-2 type transport system permease protein
MLKALIITRLHALYNSLFHKPVSRKKRNFGLKIIVAFFSLYVIASFVFMFSAFFSGICQPMVSSGFTWLYFGIAATTAISLCFIGSVFLTKGQLFEAQDNELLMSMPIPPGYILFSRILALLFLNYVIELFVLVPAGAVYCIKYKVTTTGVVFFLIEFLFLPLIPLTLSCISGWLLAFISERVRYKSFIVTLLSLICLALYIYFMAQINKYLEALIRNAGSIGIKIKNFVLPVYHFGAALENKNIYNLIIFILWAFVPFAAIYALLAHNFIRIATARKGLARIKYKRHRLKVSSPKSALLQKELRRFSSSPTYILNASFGVVLILAFAVILIIYPNLPDLITENFSGSETFINPLLIAIICLLSSTNIISAPSVSLEGKSLWIMQSLPVDGADVLIAKAKLHIVICLPAVYFASLICIFAAKMTPVQIFLILTLPAVITVFCAMFGVVINLHFPKFDWINETVVIKQSMSTGVASLAAVAFIILPILLYAFLLARIMPAEIFMLICLIIFSALCLWMYRYLKTKGSVIWANLGQ